MPYRLRADHYGCVGEMTTYEQRRGAMDLFTLNSGRRVSVDWGWETRYGPAPEFPYGFQDGDDETKDVQLSVDEEQEIFEFILANIQYEPNDSDLDDGRDFTSPYEP